MLDSNEGEFSLDSDDYWSDKELASSINKFKSEVKLKIKELKK